MPAMVVEDDRVLYASDVSSLGDPSGIETHFLNKSVS
jgi:hypothetical protein